MSSRNYNDVLQNFTGDAQRFVLDQGTNVGSVFTQDVTVVPLP